VARPCRRWNFEISLPGGELARGVEQCSADGEDSGRLGGGDARRGEDRSLEALVAGAAGGDLGNRRGEQRRQQGHGSAGGDQHAEDQAIVPAVADIGLESAEAIADDVRRTDAPLSYLPALAANGVELAEILRCGHFPRYSNPVAMWDRIAKFHARRGSPEGARQDSNLRPLVPQTDPESAPDRFLEPRR
jgi:hypothetical protein